MQLGHRVAQTASASPSFCNQEYTWELKRIAMVDFTAASKWLNVYFWL